VLDGDRVVGVKTQLGIVFGGRAVVLTTAPSRRPGARRPGKLPGRADGGSAGPVARCAAARAEPAGGTSEDRNAAAHRRPYHRHSQTQASRGTILRRCSLHGQCRDASRAAPVLDHPHHSGDARDHPRRSRPLADVHRRHRRGGAALLSVDRGQDHPLCRQGSHQIFLEPEGLTTHEIYPNGISTSLPFDVH